MDKWESVRMHIESDLHNEFARVAKNVLGTAFWIKIAHDILRRGTLSRIYEVIGDDISRQ